ncbi:hypothetical protein HGM15179_018229, partial [Zosterops borbonicus]
MSFQSTLYATTYTLIFIPGLLANSAALWVLCQFLSRKSKAVIFMINLAVADLAHVLSLPLQTYYYINHTWPFRSFLCQVCFYLKYLNVYASICFLICIMFLMPPFKFSDCRHVCDVYISIMGRVVVCVGCLPFPLLRMQHQDDKNTCFVDLPIKKLDLPTSITLMTIGELVGF